jgi:hypothetical protein
VGTIIPVTNSNNHGISEMIPVSAPTFVPIFIGLSVLILLSNQPYTPLMWIVRIAAFALILLGLKRGWQERHGD